MNTKFYYLFKLNFHRCKTIYFILLYLFFNQLNLSIEVYKDYELKGKKNKDIIYISYNL